MIRSEIEQIREAEEQALFQVRTAELDVDERVTDAKRRIENLLVTRKKEAAMIVHRMTEEMEAESEVETASLLADAQVTRNTVRAGMEERIQKATERIVQKILGENDVFSGTDE